MMSNNCEEAKDGTLSLREKEVSDSIGTSKLSVEFSSKAKISDPEEEEEEEEDDSESECCSSDEEEEEDSETEWDKDSYDGREYYSCESEASDEEEELAERSYRRMLFETKGFFVDPNIRLAPSYSSRITPLRDLDTPFLSDDGLPTRDFCSELAIVCLEKFNQRRGSSVKFEQLLWVNYRGGSGGYRGGSGPCFYITFLAKEFESPDAPLVEYQAKVVYTFLRKTYPILCRPSPDPRWMREMLKLKKITTSGRNGVDD